MQNNSETKKREWSTGICGCCAGVNANPGLFCLSCFGGGIGQGILLKDLGIVDSCVCPVVLYTALEIASARSIMILALANLRMNVAKKLNIDEGACCSFCIAGCCYPCTIAQIQRDAVDNNYHFEKTEGFVDLFKAFSGDIKGNVIQDRAMETGAPFFARRNVELMSPYRLVPPATVNGQRVTFYK